ncbi:MAG: MiaB/RimO family radical SAM methylthiotransferase [Planctomycetes bacterium]|nr:MiaB/RimO family radical SAM methylthiotransferase [Planctomycetota bacterium]MBU4400033.1 MiaB/RimO family radical SAM methylthiotransferase [Planctomycetota bacterium]MCG2684763.1 MiaB/RimO family radical SAM methylthiotransferase [Planctomycetales bacterium]
MTPRTLKTVTLGCRVNQYETEYLRQGFERLGYRDAIDGEPVDLCIVNGCVVTAESEAKTRKAIRRLAKKYPEAEIIVTGCYAARAAEEAAAMPGVVEVVADKRQLPGLLARRGLTDVPMGIERFPSRRRAYIKVQDGCLGRCSYCIVPTVRPYMTSRPAEEVLCEVRRLIENGHREIVLTGIHLGAYGNDECRMMNVELLPRPSDIHHSSFNIHHSSPSLADLVRRITDIDGDFRVRLSSIEAAEVSPELISLMAERRDRICPFLHLPMQSGSDAVLQRMNRPSTARQFIRRCREIQSSLDRPALCTDAIVGFPGETEADFQATCRAAEEVGFAKIHVFRFSPRQGTPAADMPGQVANRIVQRRAGKLGGIGGILRRRYCRRLVGRKLQVMVETTVPERPGWVLGTSEYHIPVALPGDRGLIGQFVWVTADSEEDGSIWAWSDINNPKPLGIPV